MTAPRRFRRWWIPSAALAVALLAAAVIITLDDGGPESQAAAPTGGTPAPGSSPPPVEVHIPVLAVRSSLLPVGLNTDGTIEVPPIDQPRQAAWYRHGPAPGDLGPAVLLGHVDGRGQPGIFRDLANLSTGDRIEVTRHDRTVATFAVRKVDRVAKDGFPTDAVYGETTTPQLRLITCGGGLDPATGSYQDNVIVYADLA